MNHVIDHEQHDTHIETLGGGVVNPPLRFHIASPGVIGVHPSDRDLFKSPAESRKHQYIRHHCRANIKRYLCQVIHTVHRDFQR